MSVSPYSDKIEELRGLWKAERDKLKVLKNQLIDHGLSRDEIRRDSGCKIIRKKVKALAVRRRQWNAKQISFLKRKMNKHES